MIEPIKIEEQKQLDAEQFQKIKNLGITLNPGNLSNGPKYLGLSADGWSSYYVGACWLKPGELPLLVLPKFPNIDFVGILSAALDDDVNPDYFNDSYYIDFESESIQSDTLNSLLSPLIVAHYLSVINRLLKRGLKRNYIIREENLKGNVRGHILLLKNLQQNILRGRADRTLCRYQEYSTDYPENQILKRALLASEFLLQSMAVSNNGLLQLVRTALISFDGVSPDINPSDVKCIRNDKLHGEYPMAISLAKMILRRTDFSITMNTSLKKSVPEFTIDMSRIFEFYVLSLLKKRYTSEICFQFDAGIMGRCDYLLPEECLIIDAKYKKDYPNIKAEYRREDIREVSGYGRSTRIRNKLSLLPDVQPNCLIIYPKEEPSSSYSFDNRPLIEQATKLSNVDGFYALAVPIPVV